MYYINTFICLYVINMFILTKIETIREIIRLMAYIKLNFNYKRQDFKKIFIYFFYIFFIIIACLFFKIFAKKYCY